jgi:hypothetical protein
MCGIMTMGLLYRLAFMVNVCVCVGALDPIVS